MFQYCLSEKETDSSVRVLFGADAQRMRSAECARLNDISDERPDERTSRHKISVLTCGKPQIVSCCSSGSGGVIQQVHDSSERRAPKHNLSKKLKERVNSSATLERLKRKSRHGVSSKKVINALHSSSTTKRFKGKPLLETVPENSNPQIHQERDSVTDRDRLSSTEYQQHQVRYCSPTQRTKDYHRHCPSSVELRNKMPTSCEAATSKHLASPLSEQLRFKRTSNISTGQLKTSLHSAKESNSKNRLDLSATKTLKARKKSSVQSTAQSEEYSTCPSTEQLRDERRFRSNSPEGARDDGPYSLPDVQKHVTIVRVENKEVQTDFSNTVIHVSGMSRSLTNQQDTDAPITATLDIKADTQAANKQGMLWYRALRPMAARVVSMLVRILIPLFWMGVGVGLAHVIQSVTGYGFHAVPQRKRTFSSLSIVGDVKTVINYIYGTVDYLINEYIRTSNHRLRS